MAGCRPETRCRKRRRVNQGEAATMNPILELLGRRLRLAVIGGGPGSFIGPVHRTAARLDDRFEIVAGVLSGDPARSRAGGRRHRHCAGSGLWRLAGPARRGEGARRRRRRGRGDDAQRQPPCDLRRGPGAGLRRDLRQAADDLARRRDRPRAAGARERARVLPDPQLHRLPDGPAGARHGPRRRHRPGAPDPARLRPGPQRHAGGRARARPTGASIPPPAARP